MFSENNQKIKVFLAKVSIEMQSLRQTLYSILHYAGMQILECESTDIENVLKNADCSIHIIGRNFYPDAEKELNIARNFNLINTKFKIFLWQPLERKKVILESAQEDFINNLRNNIFRNMIFTNHESPVMFTEDIRSIMHSEKLINYNVKPTEIFFIHNELDEDAVKNIIDLLDDIASLQLLNIILSSNTDYSELVAQQIGKSGLTVIFFKRSSKWALPFTQQIWKKIGGASSGATILLIGDGNHEQNMKISFAAPNVTFMAIAEELIPLEIKVQFDKLNS